MARKKDLCRDAKGRFVRNLGWKRVASGYAQQKFYLGTDERHAQLASLRLERLWEQVAARWKRTHEVAAPDAEIPAQVSLETVETFGARVSVFTCLGVPDRSMLEDVADRPVWDETTMAMAQAIRDGESTVRIPLDPSLSFCKPESSLIGDWLRGLQHDFQGIRIELADRALDEMAQQSTKDEGRRLVALGQQMIRSRGDGSRLHQALDAYSAWIATRFVRRDKRTTSWGGLQGRIVAFLKQHVEDMPLEEMDSARIESIIDILRSRPEGSKGKPVSVAWTYTSLKLFRRFLRWLHKTPDFAWRRPSDLDLEVVRIAESPEERGKKRRAAQVQTFGSEELQRCWEYADPFMRLLMLLALNCGFGRGELASLELDDVCLGSKHPHERDLGIVTGDRDGWIFRLRSKSSIYGEWKLWPETIKALEWWLPQRASLGLPSSERALLVNRHGRRFDEPTRGNHTNFQIPNRWYALIERIRKDVPDFRKLSFNKLRKTASNWIRRDAGGEIASVFLSHGKASRSDDLLDLYTNRPFAKVFEAIDRLGEQMRSTWLRFEGAFDVSTPRKTARSKRA